MSSDFSQRSRVPAGVGAGGEFSTQARSEPDVRLAPVPSSTTVTAVGVHGPLTGWVMDALATHEGLGDVLLEVERDGFGTDRFTANLTVHGRTYRLSDYDGHSYKLADPDGTPMVADVLAPLGQMADTIGQGLCTVRSRALCEHAMLTTAQMMRAEGLDYADPWAYPVALRREPKVGVTEIGFGLPGEHIKVRTFGSSDTSDGRRFAGELFAYSATRDNAGSLTARQRVNRLNKVLDHIGPTRHTAEQFVRRYLTLARTRTDELFAADPLLTSKAAH